MSVFSLTCWNGGLISRSKKAQKRYFPNLVRARTTAGKNPYSGDLKNLNTNLNWYILSFILKLFSTVFLKEDIPIIISNYNKFYWIKTSTKYLTLYYWTTWDRTKLESPSTKKDQGEVRVHFYLLNLRIFNLLNLSIHGYIGIRTQIRVKRIQTSGGSRVRFY